MGATRSPADANSESPSGPRSHPVDLRKIIERASHVLPAQGPITVFIHHNTLHAFEENYTFLDGVRRGGERFGCEPFLSESRYRAALASGRIRFAELEQVVRKSLGAVADEKLISGTSRLELRLAMLQHVLCEGPVKELLWHAAENESLHRFRSDVSAPLRSRVVAETRRWVMRDLRGSHETGRFVPTRRIPPALVDLFERFPDDLFATWSESEWEAFALQALWRVCRSGIESLPTSPPPPDKRVRHRDLLLAAIGVDSDLPVNDLLIRFTAAFLDQGFAGWELPGRDAGFFQAFCTLYRGPVAPMDVWTRRLKPELARLQDGGATPLDSVRESLTLLGVPEPEWEEYIASTLLALRGWGGMIQQVEERGDRVARPIPPGTLVEFLAIRLVLDRISLEFTARESLGFDGPLQKLRGVLREQVGAAHRPTTQQRAFRLFQLAQVLGWSPAELNAMTPAEWQTLLNEIETFDSVERRHLFHLAYELRFVTQTLDALALHAGKANRPTAPRYQVITCLDEREESFRRHLEEVATDVETFGVAGFFAVAMYYRGAADAHFVPLCPIVIRPQHWVCEQVEGTHEETHRRRAKTRKAIGTATHRFHTGSRSFALGALLSAGVGVLATFPLVARILFPRLTARIRRAVSSVVQTPPATRLKLEREAETPGPENGRLGYSLKEMTDIGERLLRDIGLISGFAKFVLSIGHGSSSLNNPHKSAYDCGACGGSPGAPNGRAIAQILNDPRVRDGLGQRGISIPPETWFVGGFHNTTNDSAALFDTDRVPVGHRPLFGQVCREIEVALDRNAHERCRRFMSAPLHMPFPAARQHVEARSEDLAQTRPELGHATNAVCHVGRRKYTRGLYLDRRAFLTSYDPTQDDEEASILLRTLSAVFPVCGGINLEYYFSHVDSAGYGCGTKLPHNVTSMLGVMDGAASDLRTGLPWQMVEIHEPVRLNIICETTPEKMRKVMDKNPMIGNMARKGWVLLALQDPDTGKIKVFENTEFRDYIPEAESLPKAVSSVDWYRGWRDHLEFAEIEPATA